MNTAVSDKPDLPGTIIESFKIAGQEGYSGYWRKDTSPVPSLELAKLLGALRKMVAHVGRNAGTVAWKNTLESDIILDPAPVLDTSPVPASKTDILMGEAIQKAFENIEMSRYALKLALARLDLGFRFTYKFKLYFKTCERIYCDCLANRSIFGVYTEKSRIQKIRSSLDVTSHPPSLAELFALWWEIAADRHSPKYLEPLKDKSSRRMMGPATLEKFYKEPMRILNRMIPKLIHDCPEIPGKRERCEFRADLYVSTWKTLFPAIKFWPVDQSDMFLQARKQESGQLKGVLKSKFPSDLVFSEKLGRVVKKKTEPDKPPEPESTVDPSIAQVEENKILLPADNFINKKLLHELNTVFKSMAARKSLYNRGLKSGSIDRRRLYRSLTTGLAFHTKKNEFNLANDMIVIADATGSMAATHKWEHTQAIFQTLFSAALNVSRNSRLFAYNEVRNRCMLSELYKKGNFFTIRPHGKTASGDVIKTLLREVKPRHKKPIFIHITDGASNWGCPIQEAIDQCKKERILLLTLGVNCSDENKVLLKAEYGRLVRFADHVNMLPQLMKNLLIRGKRAFAR